jgi:hypothetical protein
MERFISDGGLTCEAVLCFYIVIFLILTIQTKYK